MYSAEVVQRQRVEASIRMRRVHNELRASPKREQLRRAKLSGVARQRGLGGYERGSGRGKKGWYRGYWCDSTHELVFVVWALDHEIEFERNTEPFPYEFDGRVLHWTPDFLLADGTYIEIKGYVATEALAKFEFFYRPLRVLTRPDLEHVFDYVWRTYGKNVIRLYD
jgi:hypothetical protein